jgi:hypothetical protein
MGLFYICSGRECAPAWLFDIVKRDCGPALAAAGTIARAWTRDFVGRAERYRTRAGPRSITVVLRASSTRRIGRAPLIATTQRSNRRQAPRWLQAGGTKPTKENLMITIRGQQDEPRPWRRVGSGRVQLSLRQRLPPHPADLALAASCAASWALALLTSARRMRATPTSCW